MAQSAPANATTPPMMLAARCEKNPPRFLTTTVGCWLADGVEGAATAGFASGAVVLPAALLVAPVGALVPADEAALGFAGLVSFFAAPAAGKADAWKAA